MKISDQEKRNAWLSFASAALAGSSEGISDTDVTYEDIEENVVSLADDMLDAYLARFEDEGKAELDAPKRRKRG
jgi:hypothetical protein